MGTARIVVLVVASILTLGGMAVTVSRELKTRGERRVVNPKRDVVEVLAPAAGAVALLVVVWRLV